MFTDFSNRLTYFGTLDDVVYRYPGPSVLDLHSIQQQLLTAAIYDKKILINDGYLVANPQLLGDLKDIDKSLIGNMLMTGAARLFARGGTKNIAEGIEKSAEKIATHRRMVSDRSVWPAMRDDLDFLSQQVGPFIVPWPDRNMGQLFYTLLERTRGFTGDQRKSLIPEEDFRDFDAIFDRFDKAVSKPGYLGARTAWEEQCWIYFTHSVIPPNEITDVPGVPEREKRFSRYSDVRRMMNIANEIYHLAYSVAAGHSIASKEGKIDVDTSTIGMSSSLVTAFPDLVGTEAAPGAFEDRPLMDALNRLLIGLPLSLKFKKDSYFVTRLTTNGECRRARRDYLAAIKKFVEGCMDEKTAKQARETYVQALLNQLRPGLQRTWYECLTSHVLDYTFDVALGATGLGPVFEFFLPIGFDRLNNWFIERLMARRLKGAFDQQGRAALKDPTEIPLARQYGLYMGPLKRTGSESLIANVGPAPQGAAP
jgi:hypothetical protein